MAQAETEELAKLIMGAALSRSICTVAELGVADLIEQGKPQPIGHLAQEVGAHERSLYRMLRFLASHGLFAEQNDRRFDHTRLSACLRTDAEASYRPAARMMHRMFPAWEGLHHAALTGESGFQGVFQQPLFDYVGANPELAPIFDAAMTAFHGHETGAMLDAYDFDSIGVLADIGGGNGSLIGAVLQRYPQMKGILYDLGHVIGRASESLDGLGLSERCTVVEGNFFESVPAGADAYLFRHIIHDWTDEQSIQILKNCRKVIPTQGKLLIVECVISADGQPSLAMAMDMTMMAMPGGIERSEAEYRDLFEQASFELTGITPTSSEVNVIEGKPI